MTTPAAFVGPFGLPLPKTPLSEAATPQAAGQYALNGVAFGGGQNSIYIESTQILPANNSFTVQDAPIPGSDGAVFGVDTLQGLQVTFTGNVYSILGNGRANPAGALGFYDLLAAAWNKPATRLTNYAVDILQLWYPFSSEIRHCYGRGRAITPTMGMVHSGVIPFVASFQAADPNFYSNAQQQVSLIVGTTGTFFTPVPKGISPRSINNFSTSAVATNAGALPTWPIIIFSGPVQDPLLTIEATGRSIGYSGRIERHQRVVVDTRPWVRSITYDSGVSVAASMTGTGRMIDFLLPVGSTRFKFQTSGTQYNNSGGRCQIMWWPAHAMIGG